ncbi:MAG: CvpA family protein [Chloroflexi bacterium]|nr:CvpA family protein [Chloroflexota bacterium]
MTAIKPKEYKRSFARLIPPLLIGMLGVFGVAALYALNIGFRSSEFLPLLVIVSAISIGYLRGIVRGILSIITLYLSSAAAALLHRSVAPYIHATGELFSFNINASIEAGASRGSQALTFVLLTVIFWLLLELVSRATFQTPDLPQIGILDKLGGVMIHLIIGVLAASLLFNAAGYGRSRPRHDQAYLRKSFNQVLYLHYMTQKFLFERNPPSLYTYDLNAR